MTRVALVSAVYGGYDTLKRLKPQTIEVDAVCVTDDPDLAGEGWRIVYDPRPGVHPNRAAKPPKTQPWRYTDADASIWIDAAFQIRSDRFVEEAIQYAQPIGQFIHPWRTCVFDEASITMRIAKYRGEPVEAQVEHYRAEGHPEDWSLWACGVIARQHTPEVIAQGEAWQAEIDRWSFQDQLSYPFTIRRAGLRPVLFPGSYLQTPWLRYRGNPESHSTEVTEGVDLAIIVPLWQRATNIERLVASVREATPAALILFVVSDGDAPARDAVTGKKFGARTKVLTVPGVGGEPGDYARKINAGYRATTETYVFTGADDIVFHPGWYVAARGVMTDKIGVVGTVDRCNGRTADGSHSTHSLVARWYADQGACIDQDHVIYHEGYRHEFVDDELCRTAMARQAYAHAFDAVVEHKHWLLDASRFDPVYEHGQHATAESRRLYRQRCVLWGDRWGGSARVQYARPVTRRR